jgi:hypothetical protein
VKDANDIIHLVFYNTSNSTLVYATGKIGDINGGFTSMAVDNGLMGGAWADITLDDDGNPWITYQDLSRIGYYDGAKVAYRNTALFPKRSWDIQGRSNTGWDSFTVPSRYVIKDSRLNIEHAAKNDVYPSDDTESLWWNAAVGYESTDYYRAARHTRLPKNFSAPAVLPADKDP